MLIVQATDLHVTGSGWAMRGEVDTADRCAAAVAAINRLIPQPDVVVLTGDLVDDGAEASYRRLRSLLDGLHAPWLAVPGNHDTPSRMAAALSHPRHPPLTVDADYQYTDDRHDVRIVALNTHVPEQVGGRLDSARLGWLEGRLAEQPDRPTIVIQHHPPFPALHAGFDADPLDGADALFRICAGRPVMAILCGHYHRAMHVNRGGVAAISAPSTAVQVAPDLAPDARFRLSDSEPPAILAHRWAPDQGLVTTTIPIPLEPRLPA